jgi:DNA repair exonuclease SbcCD nuclease subunit
MTPSQPARSRGETARRRSLRLIHTSDVHIDSDSFSGEGREAARLRAQNAFGRVIDTLREKSADLLLVAGDLFDSSRVAQEPVDFVLSQLARASCPVVLLPGNHDCFDESSIYRRIDFRRAGPHVHVVTDVDGERLEFPELEATVWGRAMVDHDPANEPLVKVPARLGDLWHIGIAHGLLSMEGAELRSSLITARQIEESGLDYLAMGHLHVFREVSQRPTRACYSGSPVPLPLGGGKGGSVALVDLDLASGVTLRRWAIT